MTDQMTEKKTEMDYIEFMIVLLSRIARGLTIR